MLKQKARAIALGVLGGELALTVLSLPVAYLLRHGVLAPFLPSMYPVCASPSASAARRSGFV